MDYILLDDTFDKCDACGKGRSECIGFYKKDLVLYANTGEVLCDNCLPDKDGMVEVRCVCPDCQGEGWTFVSAERAKELRGLELLEEACPFGDMCEGDGDWECTKCNKWFNEEDGERSGDEFVCLDCCKEDEDSEDEKMVCGRRDKYGDVCDNFACRGYEYCSDCLDSEFYGENRENW